VRPESGLVLDIGNSLLAPKPYYHRDTEGTEKAGGKAVVSVPSVSVVQIPWSRPIFRGTAENRRAK